MKLYYNNKVIVTDIASFYYNNMGYVVDYLLNVDGTTSYRVRFDNMTQGIFRVGQLAISP